MQTHTRGTFTITRSGWIIKKLDRLCLLGHSDLNQVEMFTSVDYKDMVVIRTQ